MRSEASITTSVATSSGVVKRPVAKPPMLATTRFARGVGVDAGRLRHGCGDAVLAEPEIGGDRARARRS